ncbi:uncharacterized protein LOC135687500 [Rhopilema esculentum]|uniref:uncharacterized protein LOC135687500 n=1 Tax=Rhopilema esculentum TaxID=499914 RepID=UPI0031E2EE1E
MRPGVDRPSRRKKKVDYLEANSDNEFLYADQASPNSSESKNHSDSDDAGDIPPEFRSAGLIAQMDIPKGKVFGPFAGVISEQKASPSTMHTFICKVKDSSTLGFKYFHANKNEKKKCDWLKMIQPPFGSKSNNIVVYGNNDGVHYKAIEDIAIGEELLALCEDHQPGSIRKWAVSSRKKRPSVIVLKKTGGDEALGLSESVQVETQKRERSRRNNRRSSLAIQEKQD